MKSFKQLADLSGRTAVITGGAGHLGRAMADALAELGARVVIVDRDASACEDVAASLSEKHAPECLGLAVDLSDEAAVRQMPSRVADWSQRLDVLVNCAAFVGTSGLKGWTTPFADQSADTWRQALEVNLTAPFVLTQSCAPLLKQSGSGSVVNIASIYGVLGPDLSLYEGTSMGSPAAYAAGKGGLIQFTRWAATVLAPDIRVNCISPGGIDRRQPDSFRERYISRTPLKRLGTEEDLKGAVAYLASDLSRYVTGQNLMVDGGWSTW